jgi:hypothetical protein
MVHIQEHLDALHFTMSREDYNDMDNYHISYTQPPIDWEGRGNGYKIDQLSNIFDQEYDRQHSR